MKTLLLITSLMLVGCGHEYRVDARLAPTVQKFRDLSKQYGNEQAVDSVTIDIVPHGTIQHSEKFAGFCDGSGGIQIDENALYLPAASLEMLVFHELGHCLLGRDHSTAMLNTGMPGSIMNPSITDYPQGYQAYPEVYWKELFE